MRRVLLALLFASLSLEVRGGVAYTQPHNGGGGFYQSSWWDPDGSDYDQLTWDSFKLTNSEAVTVVRWRGGFDPSHFGLGGPVIDFTVAIYGDIANGYQPDIIQPPLVKYETGGDAGQTLAETFGGVTMYDYSFVLPSPFQAVAGSNYWMLLEAWQHGIPDWALALGTGGNGTCFRRTAGVGDFRYYIAGGETAFTLLTADAPRFLTIAGVSPTDGGIISGAGAYPSNSTVSLVATPNAGFIFVNWTENGVPVSASPSYSFTALVDRTLEAHFANAYVITTSAAPDYAGSVSAGGIFVTGTVVTVTATPASGFLFVDWTEFGTPVSTSNRYSFFADANRTPVANFQPADVTSVFDFDTGTPPLSPHDGMPASQASDGLTAYFSAPTGDWSIQAYVFSNWAPAAFSANFLYPNTWNSMLAIQFSEPITNIALKFCTADLAADVDTPTLLRVTAYTNSTAMPGVGSKSVRGAWVSGSYPEGTLSFESNTPFQVVQLDIPPGQGAKATSLFFVDNIIAQRASAPPPPLTIARTDANTVIVSWPSRWVTFVLQQNSDLSPTNWRSVTNAVSVVGANNEVTLSPPVGHEFFRLVHP